MSLTEQIDTTHWCPNCDADREPDEEYTYFEGYYIGAEVGWTSVDDLTYGEGWSSDSCGTVYVDDDDGDTVREGFLCVDCGSANSDWEDAATCCCNVCDTVSHDSGDDCDCHNIRFRFNTELFDKTGHRVVVNEEDLEGSWGMMCAICHRKFEGASSAVEHTCGVNLWPGPLRDRFLGLGWIHVVSFLDQVACAFDQETEEAEDESPIIQGAHTTHAEAVFLDEGPELLPPRKATVKGCYICNETILCCIEHGTHKAEHRGCSEA